MTRLLFWLGLGFLVFYALRKKWRAGIERVKRTEAEPAKQRPNPRIEVVLPCGRCGVHVPVSEAVIGSSGMAFCSEEHRRQHDNS